MDEMCRGISAAQFIQKFYRGHMVRRALGEKRALAGKDEMRRKRAIKVIFENI